MTTLINMYDKVHSYLQISILEIRNQTRKPMQIQTKEKYVTSYFTKCKNIFKYVNSSLLKKL